MDKKILKYLKNYIKTHSYGRNADYTLQTLFYAYETRAIDSLEGLYVATEEFIKFLIYNKQKILKDISKHYNQNRGYFEKEYEMLLMTFEHISNSYQIDQQSKFVRISKLLYSDPNIKLLDVGAGGIPLTSLLFTTDYADVSSMDKFLLSNEFLRAQNITPYNQYYTNSTDVSNFDYVVARRPCSAIPSIVKTCAKENKPYFIELCNCHLDHINLPDGSHPKSWEDILPLYDQDVKFVDNFAFNIDASKSQALQLIESTHPELFNNMVGCPEHFVAMSFLIDCFNDLEQELMLGLH